VVTIKNKLNDLDGRTWLQYSFSIWRDIQKTSEEKKLKHPAMFPISLASRLIRMFTHEGDNVLDPFMGSGSTVIAAALEGRKGIGFELSEDYFILAKNRILNLGLRKLESSYIEPEIYNEDARDSLQYISENSIDFVLTSPPYWDILNRPRTADRKQIKNYGNSKKDLGNIENYNDYLNELKFIFSLVFKQLKNGAFCSVVIMDIRKGSKFYPLHSDLANKLQEVGFSFEDIVIWDRQKEYNNMRPLGYPYVMRINKVHEYILIFRKAEL
jgi:DNA modification methylase